MRQFLSLSLLFFIGLLFGSFFVLAGGVWAWAVGANIWPGIAIGAVLGLGAVFLSFKALTKETQDLGDLAYYLIPFMLVGLALALSIVGAIVGLIIRLVS